MTKKALQVGLLGFGTVGSGAVKTLLRNGEAIERRAGRPIQLAAIADIDLETDRGVSLDAFPGLVLTKNAEEVVANPQIDVIIETIGGMKIARELVLKALESGKDVVTANKALLAEFAEEIFGAAAQRGARIGFEGAVGGGIPLIESVDGPLAGAQINRIWGILNGTCNYILAQMESGAGQFDQVLKEAQRLGYAEADPTLDIGGFDTAHKMALLAAQCFGQKVDYEKIPVEGITKIDEIDITFASLNGYQIKLLGVASRSDKQIDVRVHPALVPQDALLAHVEGVFNAAYLLGDPVGGVMLYGRGAGDLPTGNAVISDLVQLARGENAGVERYEAFCRPGLPQRDTNDIEAHFYVRCAVKEQADALNGVLAALNDAAVPVNLAERVDMNGKKVVALTGKVSRQTIDAALKTIQAAPFAAGEPYAIPIEEVGE